MFVLLAAAALVTAVPNECTLSRPVKVFSGSGWSMLPVGTAVHIDKRARQWSAITFEAGQGKASTPVLESACPASIAMPLDDVEPGEEAPSATPSTTPSSTPVPVPVAVPVYIPVAASGAGDVAVAGAPAQAIAVLDIKSDEALASTARAFTTLLVAELAGHPGYKAVSRNELQALVAHQADSSLLGCETVSCMANVGKLADAQLVVAGTLDFVDGAHVISLSLIDPAVPAVTGRQDAVWHGKPDDMLALVRPLVDRLLAGPAGADQRGGIEVIAPEGALVILDGKEIGEAPLSAPISGLTTGAHSLRVTLDGTVPYADDVVIARNETTVARVDLEELPLTQRPWLWVAVGSAVLVAGGVAAGITAWGLVSRHEPASVVLAPAPGAVSP